MRMSPDDWLAFHDIQEKAAEHEKQAESFEQTADETRILCATLAISARLEALAYVLVHDVKDEATDP